MRVKATRKGYYGDSLREPGEVFDVTPPLFSDADRRGYKGWMQLLSATDEEKAELARIEEERRIVRGGKEPAPAKVIEPARLASAPAPAPQALSAAVPVVAVLPGAGAVQSKPGDGRIPTEPPKKPAEGKASKKAGKASTGDQSVI